MATPFPTYPKIKHYKPKWLSMFGAGEVVVQSKIDGSNVSFQRLPSGEIYFMSRTIALVPSSEDMDRIFNKFVEEINSIADLLEVRYIYRGEYLSANRHNVLYYDQLPRHHVVLFDIQDADMKKYLGVDVVLSEGARLGLDVVPILYRGVADSNEFKDILRIMLDQKTRYSHVAGSPTPFLGDQFEGVVIKSYLIMDKEAPSMCKMICSEFRESAPGPGSGGWLQGPGITSQLGDLYNSPMRYQKAFQHARDAGLLRHTVEDIPLLAEETKRDIIEEELDEIKDALWASEERNISKAKKANPDTVEEIKNDLWERQKNAILKKATRDIGTWYKTQILKQ
eukprot:TRINITY_DN7743_c0_g1_i2.p1 TRINITY_DN7743_c0_g1~~TRINITY_DN7743_c0_g1_i2.p1  ORF type:complete len:360 (-),score=96.25 TRINITY_DN7743_c0_g1_i2:9-1025(-)